MLRSLLAILFAAVCILPWLPAQAALPRFRMQEIATDLGVGYAVQLVDLSGDGRVDIVVVDQKRVVWYENPDWKVHTLILEQTAADNVAIAPYDIDGDGKIEFALGAGWRPPDTHTPGTIQWLERTGEVGERWRVHPIGEEPSVHRLRWADFDEDGRAELIVVPLMGHDTSAPDWNQQPVRILSYKIPARPREDRWVAEVINDELHACHNFFPTDFDGDGHLDLLVASFEGVHLLKRSSDGQWHRQQLGTGNQTSPPNRGASEIKAGLLASGERYVATIEPWHGFEVVVYTPPKVKGEANALWDRHVIDDQLKWGHAVWCANLDDDADDELVIGVRDQRDANCLSGVRIYDAQHAQDGKWARTLLDAGGVAVEDLALADLNGDGRLEIVAVGRQTHNARIYWNEGP